MPYHLPPHNCSVCIPGAVLCVIAINWKSSRVVLCHFESMAFLVCGHVAIITETESTLHHDRVHLANVLQNSKVESPPPGKGEYKTWTMDCSMLYCFGTPLVWYVLTGFAARPHFREQTRSKWRGQRSQAE